MGVMQSHPTGFIATVATGSGNTSTELIMHRVRGSWYKPTRGVNKGKRVERIEPLFGANLAAIFARPAVQNHIMRSAMDKFRKQFPREVEYYVKRYYGRI